MEHFGLLDYMSISYMGKYNLGDYIQSVAARQYLPHVDAYIDRERLSEYDGEEIKMIMNGWYMCNADNWPPSDNIDPLFVSFHINFMAEKKMLSKKSIDYLKRHQPIGCRDFHTCDILRKAGVEAYFSGCLTLTLGRTYKRTHVGDEIIFANVLEGLTSWNEIRLRPRSFLRVLKERKLSACLHKRRYMEQIFDKDLLEQATYVDPMVPVDNPTDRFQLADSYLKRLSAAKFVVTSKIHTALPCLGMGVPVIFVRGGLDYKGEANRIGGLVDFMNQVVIDRKHNITTNCGLKLPITADAVFENPDRHLKYAEELAARCEKFVAG